jgi:hypothetical protein
VNEAETGNPTTIRFDSGLDWIWIWIWIWIGYITLGIEIGKRRDGYNTIRYKGRERRQSCIEPAREE